MFVVMHTDVDETITRKNVKNMYEQMLTHHSMMLHRYVCVQYVINR